MNDWKSRLGIVYSTNNDHEYEYEDTPQEETLPKEKQNLRIKLDKKQRKGKEVTLIDGFIGSDEDCSNLGKMLKQRCGVGGTVKEGIILIQGDHRSRVKDLLVNEGYTKTRII